MKISVIIPVRNGAQTLHRCLSALCKQALKDTLEIIVLDSGSTDASRDIAVSYGAKVIDIPGGTFNHGLTRNIGMHHATGTLIFFTVQDAWPAEKDMIAKMSNHFEDPAVMAVVGHQAVPHEKDKNPFIWYKPYSAPQVTERKVKDDEVFENLPLSEQQSLISWDNVVAMYRTSALAEQPFEKTAFAEDWIWSYNALKKGWKLLHDSSLVMYHYHHQSYQYVFSSTYTINYHFYKFFKYKPTLPALLLPMGKAAYHLLKNKKLSVREKLYWILHNWSGRLGSYFSTFNFLIRLKTGGEKSIENGFNKYCREIPQGRQRK
jgi:rhamnosyltransferase